MRASQEGERTMTEINTNRVDGKAVRAIDAYEEASRE